MPTFFTLTQGKAERRSKNEKKKDMTFDFKAVHKSKAGCFLSRQIGFPSSLLPPLQDSNFDREVIDVVRVDGKDCWYCATTWTAIRLGNQRRLEEGTNGVASDKPSNFSPLEVSNSA